MLNFSREMKILRYTIIIVIGLVIILWGISFLLSRSYTVGRSIVIEAPVDNVFTFVSDLRKWKYWSPWLTPDPNMVIHYNDRIVGNKSRMSWRSKNIGEGNVVIEIKERNKRIAYSLFLEGFENKIHGEFLFDSVNGSTQIRWIDKGDLGPSPLSKYYILVIENTIGSDFEKGLKDLKKVMEKGMIKSR